jgi:hypothetical protein
MGQTCKPRLNKGGKYLGIVLELWSSVFAIFAVEMQRSHSRARTFNQGLRRKSLYSGVIH